MSILHAIIFACSNISLQQLRVRMITAAMHRMVTNSSALAYEATKPVDLCLGID